MKVTFADGRTETVLVSKLDGSGANVATLLTVALTALETYEIAVALERTQSDYASAPRLLAFLAEGITAWARGDYLHREVPLRNPRRPTEAELKRPTEDGLRDAPPEWRERERTLVAVECAIKRETQATGSLPFRNGMDRAAGIVRGMLDAHYATMQRLTIALPPDSTDVAVNSDETFREVRNGALLLCYHELWEMRRLTVRDATGGERGLTAALFRLAEILRVNGAELPPGEDP